MVKENAKVIVNEKKADEITEVVRAEKVMAEGTWKEDMRADDVCVEDVRADDVRAEDVMVEELRMESVRVESEIGVAENIKAVDQEDEGDIMEAVSKDCEENTVHDECMLKVSILDLVW